MAVVATGIVAMFWVSSEGKVMAEGAPVSEVGIALCQIFALDGDREGNFVRIENALREAVAHGAELACFPETALLGWVNPEAHQRAHPIPGQDSDRLAALARQYKIFLCVGLAEKEDGHLYDSVVLIDDSGRILLKHRKINTLVELLTPPYTRGDTVQAVDTPLGRIGLLICADTFDGDLLDRMKDHRPNLVLVPYGWAAPESQWPEHGGELEKTVRNTARHLRCPVIGTDLVGAITHGPWTGWVYGGQSIAADADGKILARGRDRDRDVVVLKVAIKR